MGHLLHIIVETALSLLAVFGLFCLGWLAFGRILAPTAWYAPAYAVVPAKGDGSAIEQTVRELLWLRAGNLRRYTVVIADAGLTGEGKALAAALVRQESGIVLCPLSELEDYLTCERGRYIGGGDTGSNSN